MQMLQTNFLYIISTSVSTPTVHAHYLMYLPRLPFYLTINYYTLPT